MKNKKKHTQNRKTRTNNTYHQEGGSKDIIRMRL